MRRYAPWLVVLVLCAAPVRADEPKSKDVRELWDAAYLGGAKAGFFHTTFREVERGGQKFIQTTVEMDLTLKRGDAMVRLHMITGTEEDTDGKVTAVSMTQFNDQGKLVVKGTVEGKQLHVTIDQPPVDKRVGWDDEVIGLYRQERIYRELKVKKGDTVQYKSYEPTLNSVVTIHAVVKDDEEVEVLRSAGTKPVLLKERLLRVEATPEKVFLPGSKTAIPLPSMVSWLDKDRMPVHSELDMPPFGKIVLQRTTREFALAKDSKVARVDILNDTLIPLARPLSHAQDARQVVYRITVKDLDDPASAFAQDARQAVVSAKGNTLELRVRAVRGPRSDGEAGTAKPEFLESCYYLDSDNPRIQAEAREAVGTETDPWKKAQRIEAWVYQRMTASNNVSFGPASQVAEHLQGDCRQHALLAAAMCRAARVPSRTALGLVYAEPHGKPAMGFHMWAEVYINGQWLGIDGTLGRGSVGAAHIKLADSSWHDTHDLKPLLPVAAVLGKLSIEVLRVE